MRYYLSIQRRLIHRVEPQECPRHIGGSDPIVVEIPYDLGRIVGIHSARRQLPPLGSPGTTNDRLLEPSGCIVVQNMADRLARYFERVDMVAWDMAQRPRPKHQRLAANLDRHLTFYDPECFILVRVNMRRREGILRHPLLNH